MRQTQKLYTHKKNNIMSLSIKLINDEEHIYIQIQDNGVSPENEYMLIIKLNIMKFPLYRKL